MNRTARSADIPTKLIGISLPPHDFEGSFVEVHALGSEADLFRILATQYETLPAGSVILSVYDRDGYAWTGPLPAADPA